MMVKIKLTTYEICIVCMLSHDGEGGGEGRGGCVGRKEGESRGVVGHFYRGTVNQTYGKRTGSGMSTEEKFPSTFYPIGEEENNAEEPLPPTMISSLLCSSFLQHNFQDKDICLMSLHC
jgi:hypothetical protein